METRQLPSWRSVLSVPVAALDAAEASGLIGRAIADRSFLRVNFLNANNANLAMRNSRYRQGLSKSEVLPDGVGVADAAALAGATGRSAALPPAIRGRMACGMADLTSVTVRSGVCC